MTTTTILSTRRLPSSTPPRSRRDAIITLRAARRLALARGGLLKPEWTDLPATAGRGEAAARRHAHRIIDRFGYLQLDTVAVAGARSHSIVLMSRLERLGAELGESLLKPGEPLFEYWGHEVCWMPLPLYPLFDWRRKRFRHHPWWGDVIGKHADLARDILKRVADDGPLKSSDLEGESGKGWWNHKPAKSVAVALWSAGDLVVRERKAFQRTFDLPERVIPEQWRTSAVPTLADSLDALLLKALDGHGWAQASTLGRTWRLRHLQKELKAAFARLAESGAIVACQVGGDGSGDRRGGDGGRRGGSGGRVEKPLAGWIRPADLELAARLESVRPADARPVLLSPFDPLLWDRDRVQRLFNFEMTVEIFVPSHKRTFGYYCMPVLAGDRLIGRVDLKADRKTGRLKMLAWEPEVLGDLTRAASKALMTQAVTRYAEQVGLKPAWR